MGINVLYSEDPTLYKQTKHYTSTVKAKEMNVQKIKHEQGVLSKQDKRQEICRAEKCCNR